MSDKSDVIQAAWNNILLNSLSKEYVLLLCSVKSRFVRNPELFYTLWPRYGKICEALKKSCINDKFYEQICSRPRAMFLSKTNDTLDFRALDSAYIKPKDLSKPVSELLSRCYSFLRIPADLSNDFQTPPVSTFPAIQQQLRHLNVESVRERLKRRDIRKHLQKGGVDLCISDA